MFRLHEGRQKLVCLEQQLDFLLLVIEPNHEIFNLMRIDAEERRRMCIVLRRPI